MIFNIMKTMKSKSYRRHPAGFVYVWVCGSCLYSKHFWCSSSRQLEVDIPAATRRNGTMFLHIVLVNDLGKFEWHHLNREGITVVQRIPLTEYIVPKAATFNLLSSNDVSELDGFDHTIWHHQYNNLIFFLPLLTFFQSESDTTTRKSTSLTPVSHWKSKLFTTMLTDEFSVSQSDIPPEMGRLIR